MQTITDSGGNENVSVDLSEATINQDGQIIITGEDGKYKHQFNVLIHIDIYKILQNRISCSRKWHDNTSSFGSNVSNSCCKYSTFTTKCRWYSVYYTSSGMRNDLIVQVQAK